HGITSTNGSIVIRNTNGPLMVNDDIRADMGTVTLGASPQEDLLTNSASIQAAGVQLTAPRMSLSAGTINVGNSAGSIVTLDVPILRPINIDNTAGDPAGEMRLSQTELNTITCGILRIGNERAGNLTVKSPIVAPASWQTLSLISGSTIS